MRIIHTADTHLGNAAFGLSRLLEDPSRPGIIVRQRQLDIQKGFAAAIDAAIKARAELLIHSGDLFDSSRPPAFALNFAMSEIRRLTSTGASVVVVEGNHSYPRDPALGHALQILAHLERVYVAYDEPRVFELLGMKVHAYPHRAVSRGVWPKPGQTGGGLNLLIAHGVADGQLFFRGDRPAPEIRVSEVANDFLYVALGHYHRLAQVPQTGNAFYAGATAMVTWGDFHAGGRFGVILIDPASDEPVTRVDIPTRTMRAYGVDDATGLNRREVLTLLAEQERQFGAVDANCRIAVEGLDPLVRRELSVRDVEEIFRAAAAIQISLRAREQRWEAVQAGLTEAGQLGDRFAELVGQLDADASFKNDVQVLGDSFLEQAAEQLSDLDAEEAAR